MTLRTARGGYFLLELHGWRGFGRDRDLFITVTRCGLLSVSASHGLLTDKLRRLTAVIERVGEKLK